MQSFLIKTQNILGQKTHHITWINKPLSESSYITMVNWVRNSRDYSPTNPKKIKAIEDVVAGTKDKDFSILQAISIRNIVLKDKIMKNYHRMNANIKKITERYMSGESILNLSAKWDFPPLNLLRGILLHKGIKPTVIYNIFANKSKETNILNDRDLRSLKIAERNDAESTFNQQKITEIAAQNEMHLVTYFISIGIGIKTQDQLTAEQKITHGRPVLTPDILFTDIVYINEHRVHWIDYKDYIGTNINFLYKSNKEQSAKYTKEWGPGAMCYHKSFITDLKIPGSILLDARSLPIQLIEQI